VEGGAGEVSVGVCRVELQHHRSRRSSTGEANIGGREARVAGSEGREAENLFKEIVGGSVGSVIRHEQEFELELGRVKVESGEGVGNSEFT